MKVCVRNYNSDSENGDTIAVDYLVIGGERLHSEENKKKLGDSLSPMEFTTSD